MTPGHFPNPQTPQELLGVTRRQLFQRCGTGIGAMALSSLLAREAQGAGGLPTPDPARKFHHSPKAKAVIFLFMAGGPSQLELFEDKPELRKFSGKKPPKEFMEGRRFAFLKGNETLLGTRRTFARYGKTGSELSDLFPHHQKIVDDVCWLRGLTTDVFNHGPAKLFVNTGSPQPGRPSMGSWVTYGIGSESQDLPGFVVPQSGPRGPRGGAVNWGSGFLPTIHQGVPFRSSGDPIVNLSSPAGITPHHQRDTIDAVNALNLKRLVATGDQEIQTRISQYEMAYRMQTSAPELTELSGESKETMELYGADPGKPSFANNCLLARRLVERGVRFVQLYHT